MNAVKPTFRPVARLLALALAFAAAAPRASFAYDSNHDAEKTRLRLQKEEEIRKMEEREEAAKRRIAWNREKGNAELSEIREIVKQGRTAVDSATERANSVLKKTGEPLPLDLRKFGLQCQRRISTLEESISDCERKLHSSDFVSEIVVASIQALKHEATLALADAQRLSETMIRFDASIADRATTDSDTALRKKRLLAAVAVSAAVLALAAIIAVSVSKRKKPSATTVSRGPLRPVHPLPK